jgi:hypothetical protein
LIFRCLRGWTIGLTAAAAALVPASYSLAAPLGAAALARLSSGRGEQVIVEYDVAAIDRTLGQQRQRRGLLVDDGALRAQRVQNYAAIKAAAEARAAGADSTRLRDYAGLPLAFWRINTPAALARLQATPGVRAVHEDRMLRVNSVSDLSFIHQPEVVAEGATGAGTVVAIIDGGLGNSYLSFSDFGPCTAVNFPASTCRVRYNHNYYTGAQASHETLHGTNVSAIALGVAPGTKLAMYNVFGWFFDPGTQSNVSGAFTSDILDALNNVLTSFNASSFNVVAVNMSLGDEAANATACTGSAFASAIAALANVGIATVAAAGNSGAKSGLADPACAPRAVSVGAVYSAAHSPTLWGGPGSCAETGAPDLVACFSQSASYLTVLAPGLFVDAPNASFQQSGTSQAAPHVTGALAVLHARYALEPMTQSVQRLRDTGSPVADALAAGRVTPRMDLLAALHEAVRLDLSASGPTWAVSGQTGTFVLGVANQGTLIGTGISTLLSLPAGTTIVSVSAGCAINGSVVTCTAGNLAVGSSATFTVQVRWSFTGAVSGSVVVRSDQINASSIQQVALDGSGTGSIGDAPLPLWANALLAAGLLAGLHRAQRGLATRASGLAPAP